MSGPPRILPAARVHGGPARTVRGSSGRTPAAGTEAPQGASLGAARISLGRAFQAESSNYYLLLGVTLFMVVFGLIMVLSSSAVDSHTAGDNFFSRFLSQGMYAVVGVPIMLLASRIPSRFWKRMAWPILIGALLLQVLVVATPLGSDNGYNQNWLKLGPIVFQPSEVIKIAMILWMGMFVSRKWEKITQWKYGLLPMVLVTAVTVGLVLAGGDLGTTSIMGAIVLGTLFFAGIPIRQLATTALLAGGIAVLFAISRPSRLNRITDFLHPNASDPMSGGWQILQGNYALASGGVFGVGLGNSTSKWNWLPAADTDFIFAIVGEELGLIGAVVVLVLFVVLAIVFVRIMHASADPFARVVTGAVMIWLVGQGLVNIAVVLGVMPVLGVPLPLISAGGTALISSLFAIGVVLSFARSNSR
ncbi:MAG TPA: putative lipid II flippase FtsW [Humibacter sp.]|nr:putative lipid II flippase FtsW [Humibacter sp.]